jgi:hypothetical protein
MRVAAQITKDVLGATEGRLGVHNPVAAIATIEQLLKGSGIGKRLDAALQTEPVALIGLLKTGEELAPKQLAQNPDREEEVRLAGDPL